MHDATCPFVAKIHRLAQRAGEEGKPLLVAGDSTHPEVVGIVGHTTGPVFVFSNLEELERLNLPEISKNGGFVVAQTTFEAKKWRECVEFLKKVYTNLEIFDTICNATWARQHEAECLARQCDLMIIIGGRHSSNTQKLVTVAGHYTCLLYTSLVIYLGGGKPIEGWTTTMLVLTLGFFGVFLILAVVLRYLTLLVDLVFKHQRYLVEGIEKIQKEQSDA